MLYQAPEAVVPDSTMSRPSDVYRQDSMSSIPPSQTPGPPRSRRYKAVLACTTCRRRKLKCDGSRPVCGRCQKKDALREQCTYTRPSSASRSGGSSYPVQPAVSTPNLPTPSASSFSRPEQSDVAEAGDAYTDEDTREFPSAVKSTIDARLGLPSTKRRCPIPLTDAPMFGPLSIPQDTEDGHFNQADNVLPPRKEADHLVRLYWQYLEPLEALLDEKQFHRSYESLFTGVELGSDERIFLATLNLIFSLSIQLQESAPSQQRDDSSKTFFLRAWHLLRPETILWDAGSLELVQCLLLMSRYLQCTRNLHQTWMALGSAVRIAQSLGLHTSCNSSSSLDESGFDGNTHWRQRVWRCCVSMDRSLSWSLGRPPIALFTNSSSFNAPQNTVDATSHDTENSNLISIKMREVDELTHYIFSSQRSNTLTESLCLPSLTQSTDSKVAAQLDDRLIELENSLPLPTLLDSSPIDTLSSGPLTLLRLRLSHARIFLFRPMLARLCLSRSQTSTSANPSLEDRILQECATLCVESSQNMISLAQESSRLDQQGVGILPWWLRVFYLYVAIQHLIASMLRPEVFASIVPEAWNTAMTVLEAHEHLSQSVTRCLTSFRSMWQKVMDINYPPQTQGPLPGVDNQVFQDIFEHLGFDAELPVFDLDNAAWLENVDWNM